LTSETRKKPLKSAKGLEKQAPFCYNILKATKSLPEEIQSWWFFVRGQSIIDAKNKGAFP